LRSIRLRSPSAASTMRARDALSPAANASRSATAAASARVTIADMTMNSCSARTDWGTEWNTNGPLRWAVFQVLIVASTTITTVTPHSRKRRAAQISTGNAR
jgi:hypothetical protein